MTAQDTLAAAKSARAPAQSLNISFVEFVAMTATLMALTALSIDIMLPALPAIGDALGVENHNDRQQIVILYMAGFAAGQLFYGPLSDRFGRKPVLLFGLALFIAGSIGALLAHSFTALLGARLIQGLGAASPRVVAIAVVRDLYAGRQMARVMSLAMMVFIVIPVLAPTIGSALMHLGDWHIMFYVLLAIGVLVALWSGLRLPETARQVLLHEQPQTLAASFKAAIFTPQTLGYGLCGGLMFGCLLSYVASAQQIYADVFNAEALFPVLFGAVASVMAIASFINSRLVERLGMRAVSHTALLCSVATALMLSLTAYSGLASLMIFSALVAGIFFFFGLIAPNFNALAMEPQGSNAGMASSVAGALSTATGALAGGLIGASFNGSVVPLAFGILSCTLLTCVIVYLVEGRAGLFGRQARAI
jgi:DHA1 family bicyclomycin/chloramphenicol resistance-like MFS transporter